MSSEVEKCGEVLCASACMLSVFASDGALADNCPVGPISGLSSLKTPPPTTTKQQARTKHWPLGPNSKTAELRSFALLVDGIWICALRNQVLDCLHMSLVRGEHSRWKAGEQGHYCQASGCKNGQSNPKQPSTEGLFHTSFRTNDHWCNKVPWTPQQHPCKSQPIANPASVWPSPETPRRTVRFGRSP